jgi:Zn-dependent protease/CBS domain-containing protein
MFGKRVNILTFAGIKIGIDFSWIFIAVLLSWTLAAGYFPFRYPHLSNEMYWLMGIFGMLGLFICIVLHELGHALVAKYYKLPISQITLFIFGGVAEIKKEPSRPKVEFLMAIAGPLVSVVLVVGLYALTLLGEKSGWPVLFTGVTRYLATINLVIVAFNLIPAFPLDGGRVLRAILWWWKKDFGWATKIATRIGAAFSFLLIFLGIFALITGNLLAGMWFMILGWFLNRAAASTHSQYYVSKELRHEKVSNFMTKHPITVSPDITIKEFIDKYVYASHHHLYPVTEEENLIGYISLKEIKLLPKEKWSTTLVETVMIPRADFKTVTPDSSALEALNLMQKTDTSTLLVVTRRRLVGILTAQSLFKLISLKLELQQATQK